MELYGLLGETLCHSFSPMIHENIFEKVKKKGHYHLFEVKREDIKKALQGLLALGIKGVNVTIPYKIEVMKNLDEIGEEAKKIGAVNTISFENNKMIGYNTDYYGFGMMLTHYDIDVAGKSAVILGSGGAAHGVIQYLLDKGIEEIIMVSRTPQKVFQAHKEVFVISYDELENLESKDMIINCTPCGMYPKIDVSPVKENIIVKFHTAIDLIYNPYETLFLSYANKNNVKAVNGLYMLVGQAMKSQEIWNHMTFSEKERNEIYEKIKSVMV
ncbi:shikimate dehydrogenase [Inediibacterium massiliense]|uniref:shikimate dehydrogenase n=1 Tax=Inediibacterium massiliense TaxID=1658111 RepID=UPI0006B56660|nr:shikimate dehydrogenase [Inediibacterium massiliense]